MDNLPELKDIHLPIEEISMFPPAYGWWVILAVMALTVVTYVLIRQIRSSSAKLYAKYLLKNIENDDTLAAAIKISEILRRICVVKYPQAVALSDAEWIDFLNSKVSNKIDGKTAEILKNAPYMPVEKQTDYADEVKKIRQFCYNWVGENL
ncbi:MAG: DUF4381 domain-containing protein [Alphaproteobacteria bacterium]|nr:DUF4381 domain-containing protein [Alphaproteobacteria bacterium]